MKTITLDVYTRDEASAICNADESWTDLDLQQDLMYRTLFSERRPIAVLGDDGELVAPWLEILDSDS